MTGRAYTMRALLTLARERFGDKANQLKTRDELMVALGFAESRTDVSPPAPEAPKAALVVRDFFVAPR